MALKIIEQKDRLLLAVHVQPRASRTEISGSHGEALKVRLTAPPVEERANRQLVDFLARALGLPRSSLALVRGSRGREKTVAIKGIGRQELLRRLTQYLV